MQHSFAKLEYAPLARLLMAECMYPMMFTRNSSQQTSRTFPSLQMLAQGKVSLASRAAPQPVPLHFLRTLGTSKYHSISSRHLDIDPEHELLRLVFDHVDHPALSLLDRSAMNEGTNRQAVGFDPPATPRRLHIDANKAVNERIRYLRDELGLAINPRETIFSPSHFTNLPADRLHDRVKYLTFKKPSELDEAIETYRTELANDLKHLSAQKRVEGLFDKLRDLNWLAQNSVAPAKRVTQSPSTVPNTPSKPQQPPMKRVDSTLTLGPESKLASPRSCRSVGRSASRATLAAESVPLPTSPTSHKSINNNTYEYSPDSDKLPASPSPTMRRSVYASMSDPRSTSSSNRTTRHSSSTGEGRSRSATANTSFATNIIDLTDDDEPLKLQSTASQNPFGSSWATQEMTPLRKNSESIDNKQLPSAALQEYDSPPSKRRRSGESNFRAIQSSDSDQPAKQKYGKRIQHHKIRDLPSNGFGTDRSYSFDEKTPYVVSVERARLAHGTPLTPDQTAAIVDAKTAKDVLTSHKIKSFQPSCHDIWHPDAYKNANLALHGKMHWNPKSDKNPLLQIKMSPIKKEAKSTRVTNHFGSDRVLTVTMPSLVRDLPEHLNGHREDLAAAALKWLLTPREFLGRTWCVFHTKRLEKKIFGKKIKDTSADREYSFFAICGDGIREPISHADFIKWMFPFEENAVQAVCKAFARFDLSVSRITSTVQLKPDQIRFVDDILANGEAEDEKWEDTKFNGLLLHIFGDQEVMTDGCARISVGAALLIREILGITGWPSTFQGRINGAKGIWHISAPYETLNKKDLEIWIEIRPSQTKIKPRSEDLDNFKCEPDRWSFDVVQCNPTPKCSQIYKDLLAILEDRGVSRNVLLEMIAEAIAFPVQEWRDADKDSARLALQRYRLFGWSDDKPKTSEPGLPRSPAAKCQLFMDQGGFMPENCQPLAEALERMQEMCFQHSRSQLKFTCLKSTMVLGIADPHCVLKPGEIHLSLSQPLVHESTKETFDMFSSKHVLVARHPTLRGSDMQKVKCICHPKLAHLKDVVVMSSRGQIPLAAKLQGGDYDGDTFWICADPRLVEPFKNAPVLEQAGIDKFPIKQEKRRLVDLVDENQFGTDEHVRRWLAIVLQFATRDQMLGKVTGYLNNLTYHRNDLWHPGVAMMADLHDLIIDDAKNGYQFDARDFAKVRSDHKDLLPEPEKLADGVRYRKNLDFDFDSGKDTKATLRSTLRKFPAKAYTSILDEAVFKIINPAFADHLEEFHENVVVPAENMRRDPDLEYTLEMIPTSLKQAEEAHLKTQLDLVWKEWQLLWAALKRTSSKPKAQTDLTNSLQKCVDNYNAILPLETTNPFWKFRQGETAPSIWDCYKVAFLARGYYAEKRCRSDPESRRNFMFWIARDVVCHLKSQSRSGKAVIERVSRVKKPKAPKDWSLVDACEGFSREVYWREDEGGEDDDEFGLGFDEEDLEFLDQSS